MKEYGVTPNGDLIKSKTKGSFWGDRGILHNEKGSLGIKRWSHHSWVYCLSELSGQKHPLNASNSFTPLSFFDEATALAAGHRPCATCHPERLQELLHNIRVSKAVPSSHLKLTTLDKIVHRERVTPAREKITFREKLKNLPDGVVVRFPQVKGVFYLFTDEVLRMWSPFGYLQPFSVPLESEVVVLTPLTFVKAFGAGFKPEVGRGKPVGLEQPHFHEEWCLKILEKLKKDFPLPEHVELCLDFQPVNLVRSKSMTGGGIYRTTFKGALLQVAMQDNVPLKERLDRTAHEYWHAYQAHVCHQSSDRRWAGRKERDARDFANEYAVMFMKENGLSHLLSNTSTGEDYQARRKRALIQMEAIIGRHFFNPRLPTSTLSARFHKIESTHRSPLYIRNGVVKEKHYFLHQSIPEDIMRSGHYFENGSELQIMEALDELLTFLEKEKGLQI